VRGEGGGRARGNQKDGVAASRAGKSHTKAKERKKTKEEGGKKKRGNCNSSEAAQKTAMREGRLDTNRTPEPPITTLKMKNPL